MTREKNRTTDSKSTLTPKLRFPCFRASPAWHEKSIGETYSFKSSNSFSREKLNYSNGTVKNIHYGDIHTKFSTLFDVTKERVPFINSSESLDGLREENYCVEGDMIFADASEDLDDIGKSIEVIRLNGERVVAGQHTILARPNYDDLAIGFGGHLFKCQFVRGQIKNESQGSKVLGISPTRLSKIGLPLPPTKAEQVRVADCLSTLDDLIAAESQKLDALKAHKKGLMQQLFPREGETRPRLRFPEFCNAPDWKERKLENLAKRGSGHTPNKAHSEYYNGGIPWVSLADSRRLDSGLISETEIEISEEGIENSSARLHPAGTVLISRDAGVGKSAVMALPMAVSQHFIVWTCETNDLSNWFLYHLLQKMKPVFERVATGSTIKTIGLPFFKDLIATIPSLPEQERIAACLSSLDDLIAAQGSQLELLRTHKRGLMQQLFPSPEAAEA